MAVSLSPTEDLDRNARRVDIVSNRNSALRFQFRLVLPFYHHAIYEALSIMTPITIPLEQLQKFNDGDRGVYQGGWVYAHSAVWNPTRGRSTLKGKVDGCSSQHRKRKHFGD